MIARIITITTTAIIMFLFLLGPSNIAMALPFSTCSLSVLCQLTNKPGHSQNQNGPLAQKGPREPDPRDLMRPFPADLMRMWPISTRVNKPDLCTRECAILAGGASNTTRLSRVALGKRDGQRASATTALE
jgi:hypothetical protein